MRAVLLAATILLTACAAQPQIPITVTKYVHTPISAQLLQPCSAATPDPACWRDTTRVYCNGQIKDMIADYRDALARCNADKAAIQAADK